MLVAVLCGWRLLHLPGVACHDHLAQCLEAAFALHGIDLSLPDHIAEIPNQCFTNAHFYGNLHLPDAATTLGDSCFYNCKFSKQLVLPDGIGKLSNLSFGFCTFNGLVLPSALKKIDANVFPGSSFIAPFVLPEGLEEIGSGAFARTMFNNITLTIPACVIVDRGAFVNCQISKMVWQGETFDGLGSAPYLLTDPYYLDEYGAIKPIYSVKILDLGTSVPDKYSLSPFRIERLYVHSTTPPAVNGELYYLVHEVQYHYTATLYVPRGCKEIYSKTSPWSYYPNIVEFDETQEMPFVGDVNCDGRINVSDISTLVNDILTGPTEQSFLNDDVNEDTRVNVSDVTALINIILGIS